MTGIFRALQSLEAATKQRIIDGIVYAAAGIVGVLVVLHSIPPARLVIGGDAPAPELNPKIALDRLSSDWAFYGGLGKDNSFALPSLFPVVAFDRAAEALGASILAVNHFWLFLIIVLQAILTIRLLRELFPELRYWPAMLYAGLASFLNPYTLIAYHAPYVALNLSVAVFPGVLAAAIGFVRSGRIVALAEYSLWLAIGSTGNANPAFIMLEAAILLLVCVIGMWKCKTHGGRLRIVEATLLYLAVNSLWWIPIAHHVISSFSNLVSESRTYTENTLASTAQFTTLFTAFRLVGGYLFFNKVGKELFLPAGPQYVQNPLLIAATLVMPVLALAAVFIGRKPRTVAVVIAGLTAVALFFAKGTAGPDGQIFAWLSFHVRPFEAFRDSFNKFEWIVLFGYALLAALTLSIVAERYGRRWAATVSVAAFCALAVAAYPIVAGWLFWRGMFVTIPPEYNRVAQLLNGLPDKSRVLEMPVASFIFDTYKWGYVGGGIDPDLIARPVVSRKFDFDEPGNQALNDLMRDYQMSVGSAQTAALLGLFGIGYILDDTAINSSYYTPSYASHLEPPIPHIVRQKRFGSISIYKVNQDLLNDIVYTPHKLIEGPRNVAQAAIACRLEGSCRNVAIVPHGIAESLGRDRTIVYSFGRGAPRKEREVRQWYVPPLVHQVARGPTPSDPQIEYLTDYGNAATLSSNPDQVVTPLITYGRGKAVRVTIGSGGESRHVDFTRIYESKQSSITGNRGHGPPFSVSPGVCPQSYRIFRLPLNRLRGKVVLVALRYKESRAAAHLLTSLVLFDSREHNTYEATLLDAPREHVFARLFFIPPQTKALSLGAIVRSGEGGCLRISDLIVAVAQNRTRWNLLGSPSDFYTTSLFVAGNDSIIGHYRNEAEHWQGSPPATRALPEMAATAHAAPLLDTATRWSQPETLSSTVDRLCLVSALPRRERGNQVFTFAVRNELADVHVKFSRLLPGATYRIHFALARATTLPRIAVLSENGQVLYDQFARLDRSQQVQILIQNPPDSIAVFLYVYLGDFLANSESVTLSEPMISLAEEEQGYITRQARLQRDLSAPVHVVEEGPSAFRLRVSHAPQRYLVILNTTFDSGWLLSSPRNVRATHFVANLFANGWEVSGPGSYVLELRYEGDDFWRLGETVCLALVLLVLIIEYSRRLKR